MRHVKLTLLASAASVLLLNQTAHAAAFQLYELGTPIIGTAGVGQAAEASDASTSYFNPAGMTQLDSTQYMLGGQMLLPFTHFSRRVNQTTISGDNGGDAGSLIPGVSLFYVYHVSSKFRAGISLTSPYGGSLSYNNGWVGRYVVQNMQFFTIDINPALAYEINQQFSVGLGATVEYANLHETVALPTALSPLLDGQANIKVSNYKPGVNFGIFYKPTDSTKMGLAYRSQISHNLHGDLTFLRIAATPNTSTRMIMPQNVIVSLDQSVTPTIALLGELGWSNWSSMRNTVLNVAGYTSTIPRDWHNTYRVGLAGQYKWNHALMLQAGASYDSSPTSSSLRLPDLPMDRQLRFGAGLTYMMIHNANLGFSYEYINFGHANINNISTNGVLSGSYSRNYANTFQMSINVAC